MNEKPSKWKVFTAGIIRENPVLRLVLGCCSALAVTTTVSGALGMGLAMTFVLVCSNIVISALRKVIPAKVHLPCYIVIIATFVTLLQLAVSAWAPALNASLGIFIPLIVVNCILLGRAEAFAGKHGVIDSICDGLGCGIQRHAARADNGNVNELFDVLDLRQIAVFGHIHRRVRPEPRLPGYKPLVFPCGMYSAFPELRRKPLKSYRISCFRVVAARGACYNNGENQPNSVKKSASKPMTDHGRHALWFPLG